MNTQTLHKHRGWGKDLGSYKIPDSDVNWPGCPSWPSYMASSDVAVIWELSGAVGGGTQGSLSSRTALGEKVEKAHCFNHQA